MLRYFYTLSGWAAGAVGCLLLAIFVLFTLSTHLPFVSFVVSALLASNLVLMVVLARAWFFPRCDSEADRRSHQPAESWADMPVLTGSQSVNLLPPEKEPFTMGVATFEPAEPVSTLAPIPSTNKNPAVGVSVADTHQKSQRPLLNQKQSVLNRFMFVCRTLKQLNQEVAIWTEDELISLADTRLDIASEDRDMIAVLLPQNVVCLKTLRTFEQQYHAQLFRKLLDASGKTLPIHYITSTKDIKTGRCELSFEYCNQPISWRFTERGNQLSDKFLRKACRWVGKHRSGQFTILKDEGFRISLVFILDVVNRQLNVSSLTV
jgi:hypothetical protein